ncbi:hypothetical protein CXF85_19280 [Colwellia sp. 75C3]|uniref:PEP-CTERM sorting domain-containing protein n=1 Tax=Colwellia sp. 75C3 TaxID=888425 RepID=UPI000C3352B1|nr:PEP-CTERM sorting domain-containing protein [Colwellia sp. 75C3]PKG81595.1 hypothetical protein CXF85_19280 [Colwellia sp. 75C3]
MNNFKTIIAASVIALASTTVSADEITAGGISWDETERNNGVAAGFTFQEWFTNTTTGNTVLAAVGTELVGVGEFNGFFESRGVGYTFNPTVCNFCELTFSFGGLVVESVSSAGVVYDTTNAFLNVYMDKDHNTPYVDILGNNALEIGNFSNGTAASNTAYTQVIEATDGDLWASFDIDSYGKLGGDVFTTMELSVTGGSAAAELDYNNDPLFDVSDIVMTKSAIRGALDLYTTQSNGQFFNKVPEPTSIALFGLALMGLAGAARRKA